MPSMFDISIPPMIRAMRNLSRILSKGERHAQNHALNPEDLLQARLYADMYPLTRQVQIATDICKGAGARLSRQAIPVFEDIETTFPALQNRIDRTIDFLDTIRFEDLEDSESLTIVLTLNQHEVTFTGQDYFLKWALPNVYFHVTTAYAILRHAGVPLGKSDYLGPRK